MLEVEGVERRDCQIYGGLLGLIAGLLVFAILQGVLPGILLVVLALGGLAAGAVLGPKYCTGNETQEDAPARATAREPAPKAAAPASKPAPAPKPAAPDQAPVPEAAAPKSAPSPAAPARAAPAPAATGDASKPALLIEARGGKADDLKLIKGVGPKLEKTLHDLGVYHYDQIAAWTAGEIAWVDDHLKFRGRIERDGWIAQARTLAAGGKTEFSARAAMGDVPSSQG